MQNKVEFSDILLVLTLNAWCALKGWSSFSKFLHKWFSNSRSSIIAIISIWFGKIWKIRAFHGMMRNFPQVLWEEQKYAQIARSQCKFAALPGGMAYWNELEICAQISFIHSMSQLCRVAIFVSSGAPSKSVFPCVQWSTFVATRRNSVYCALQDAIEFFLQAANSQGNNEILIDANGMCSRISWGFTFRLNCMELSDSQPHVTATFTLRKLIYWFALAFSLLKDP